MYLAAGGLTVRGDELSLDGVIHSVRKNECICLNPIEIDDNGNPTDLDTVNTLYTIGEKQKAGWTVLSQLANRLRSQNG